MEKIYNTEMDGLYNKVSEEEYKLRLEQLTEKDVAVFEELGSVPIENVHSEAFIAVLCLEGKATAVIEGKEYHIEKGDMVFSHPNQFIQSALVSCDFKCRGILMSPAYFESIFMLGGNMWEASYLLRNQPLFHVDEKMMGMFLFNYDVLKNKLATTDLPHHQQIVKLYLQSMIYEFYDYISPMLNHQLGEHSYSSGDVIFKHFMSIASAEAPRRRDVSYYADKLCITPKYLSAICKKQTGKTASEIINKMTLNYISQMLRSSDKSIKEIASDAGFDNLSFFGKYVKRELGMSPREYRAKGE